MNIDFTVITVCLNAENVISQTVTSVIEQSNCHLEYIIQDGLSKDNTLGLIKELLKNSTTITYSIFSEGDSGIYDAMNKAVKKAHGEWIIFMNAGDTFYSKDTLSMLKSKIKDSHADIVYGNTIMKDISGDSVFLADLSLIKYRTPFCHQSTLAKKELWEQYPFNDTYRLLADYDFFSYAYIHNAKFEKSDLIIAIYLMDGISSASFFQRVLEQNDIRCKYGFAKRKYNLYFIRQYIEAIIKTMLVKSLPIEKQHGLRRFYTKHIKKYCTMEGKNVQGLYEREYENTTHHI